MNRTRAAALGAVAILCLALRSGSGLRAGDDAAKDKALLQGRWQAVVLEVRGKIAPPEEVEKYSIHIKGDTFILTTGKLDREATFELDPKARPKAIDLTPGQGPHKGMKLPAGIYELDGDRLKLCVVRDPHKNGRPREFKTEAGGAQTLVILKRLKE